ncbi:MAG: DUF374 domain-containing protein, partial [bacterium]|nr:DUF374 domain-containing protein [bacterium]
MNKTRPTKVLRRHVGDWIFGAFLAPFVAWLIRLFAATLRIEVEGGAHYEAARRCGRPLIFAFWHEDLFGMAMGFLRLGTGLRVAVMVSPSRDGEKLARVIHRLGLQTVRASSSRGAARGLLEMKGRMTAAATAEAHAAAALALDGPRGPRRVAKPGVALLGRQTEALIVPVSFVHSR